MTSLTLSLSAANRTAIILIKAYQHFLSPIKGYQCAHRLLHGGSSCSWVGLEAFSTYRFDEAVYIIRSRFRECHQAALELGTIGSPKAVGVGCCGTGCSC